MHVAERSPSALILDRDGVINRELGHGVTSWAEFEFLPGVFEALAQLRQLPCPILVTTNQSAIGRGYVEESVVGVIHDEMRRAIDLTGGRIDGVFYCPHGPDHGCACRKPMPGLILQAAQQFGFDSGQAWVVGDSLRDLEAGWGVGARCFLVRSGKPITAELERLVVAKTGEVFDDLLAFALKVESWSCD